MPKHSTIVFVCEHGAAKSILAAAYFNEMAGSARLDIEAVARGTNPDSALSEQVIKGLAKDGLQPTESAPRKLAFEDAQSAHRIIGFCELPPEYQEPALVEQWDGIPAVSENYDEARDAIIEHLNDLLQNLRSSQ